MPGWPALQEVTILPTAISFLKYTVFDLTNLGVVYMFQKFPRACCSTKRFCEHHLDQHLHFLHLHRLMHFSGAALSVLRLLLLQVIMIFDVRISLYPDSSDRIRKVCADDIHWNPDYRAGCPVRSDIPLAPQQVSRLLLRFNRKNKSFGFTWECTHKNDCNKTM